MNESQNPATRTPAPEAARQATSGHISSPDKCPVCGSPEIEANTPRTVYACGSSDYDKRPGTFTQKCSAPEAVAGEQSGPFQARVHPWLLACFGQEIADDKQERNHRFCEESLELVQSTGCTKSEVLQLVEYVYNRPSGIPNQEVGGVMVTLAALCLAQGLNMHHAGEQELNRIWTKVEKIRAKQAAKPKHSPLPEAPTPPEADKDAEKQWRREGRAEAMAILVREDAETFADKFTSESALGDTGDCFIGWNYAELETLLDVDSGKSMVENIEAETWRLRGELMERESDLTTARATIAALTKSRDDFKRYADTLNSQSIRSDEENRATIAERDQRIAELVGAIKSAPHEPTCNYDTPIEFAKRHGINPVCDCWKSAALAHAAEGKEQA